MVNKEDLQDTVALFLSPIGLHVYSIGKMPPCPLNENYDSFHESSVLRYVGFFFNILQFFITNLVSYIHYHGLPWWLRW